MSSQAVLLLGLVLVLLRWARGVELTFELYDSSKECFHEHIEKNVSTLLQFQVVSGGQYDVDLTVQDPNNKVVYRQLRQQYNSHTFLPITTGVYTVCFSNEFSTFSHKMVYMKLEVGEAPDALPSYLDNLSVMTKMESSVDELHDKLVNITGLQTRQRLTEAQGRRRAEELNDRVMWWSVGETLAIVVVVMGEVVALRNLFPGVRLTVTVI